MPRRIEPERVTDTHVYFWGSVYSNWFMQDFEDNGVIYCCGEQHMMAKKAELFGDKEILKEIMKERNPKKQKALGRQVKGYDDAVWSNERFEIVRQGQYRRFSQNPSSKKMLLSTGNKIIVEASPYDDIWGVKLGPFDDRVLDEKNWRGLNLLGKVHMENRTIFRQEAKPVAKGRVLGAGRPPGPFGPGR